MAPEFNVYSLPVGIKAPLESVFRSVAGLEGSALLLSRGGVADTARYSIACFNPFMSVKSYGMDTIIDERGTRKKTKGEPFEILDSLLSRYQVVPPRELVIKGELPPFTGGAVGYFGYDLRTITEKLPSTGINDIKTPDMCFCFYETVLVEDSHSGKINIFSVDFINNNLKVAERKAHEFLNCLESDSDKRAFRTGSLKSNFEKSQYIEALKRIKKYILAGDVYQVNMSQRFNADFEGDIYALFEYLSNINPAPSSAYLNEGDFSVVSSSPERFIRIYGRMIETRPIKGTRPRGKTAREDEKLRKELVSSEKDRAEISMIVDLERNDLGRSCEFGSVLVDEHCRLESHPTVFHLVSIVRGRLRKEISPVQALRAAFPGGSITGAPKIRAMEIIDELEPHARGIYTGAIGCVGYNGYLDTNIVIRTMVLKNGKVYFNVGGGIVADSDPEAEYQETLDKARALITSLEGKKQEK